MKNKPLIIGIVVLLIVGAGVLYFVRGGQMSLTPQSPEQMVSNALTGTGSARCEYTDGDGQVVTAYIKNGNIRTDLTGGPEGNMSFLMTNQTTYSWNQETKEGFMYQIPEQEVEVEEDEAMAMEHDQMGGKDLEKEIEQYKDSCTNQTVSDSMFAVPTDVNFVDYSTMMEETMQQLPQEYQQYIPQQ